MPSANNVLILIPAFNEAAHIGKVVAQVRKFGYSHIVVIDDGSSDNTSGVAKRAGANVLRHIVNRGPGAATETGLQYAREHTGFEFVITMDGDEQHDPKDIDILLEALIDKKADIAIGNRFLLGNNYIPRARVIFNGIANLVTFFFSWKWVSDTQSGLKAIRSSALDFLCIHLDGYEFCSEIIIKARRHKLMLIEVPVHVSYSEESMKKGQGVLVGLKTFINLIYTLLFRHSKK